MIRSSRISRRRFLRSATEMPAGVGILSAGFHLALICGMSSVAVAAEWEWRPADPAHWNATGFDFSGWNERVHRIKNSDTTTGGATAPHDLVSVDLARVGATAIEYSSLAVVETRTGAFVSRAGLAKAGRQDIYRGPHAGCDVLDLVNVNDPELQSFRFHATPVGEFWIEDERGSYNHGRVVHRIMMLEDGCLMTATIFEGLRWLWTDGDGVFQTTSYKVSFGLDEDGTPLVTEAYSDQQTPCGKTVTFWERRTRRYRLTAGSAALVDSSARKGYSQLTFPFSDRLVATSIPRARWEKNWRPGVRAGVIAKGEVVSVVERVLPGDGPGPDIYRIIGVKTGTEGFAYAGDLHRACLYSIPPCGESMRDCPND